MSSEIATYNFCVRSGNTGTTGKDEGLVFTSPDASDYEWHFKTGAFTGGPIAKTSPGDITVSGDTVTIPFSLVDNQAIADAAAAITYEVERRDTGTGTQRTIMLGNVTGIQGVTDD